MCRPANDPTVQQKLRIAWHNISSVSEDGWVWSALVWFSQRFHSNDSMSRISFSLIWPVIISSTQVYGTNRTVVKVILDAFRGQCK